MSETNDVWGFSGAGGKIPAAIFSTKESAETGIKEKWLIGVLTKYPLNEDVYSWAIKTIISNLTTNKKHRPSLDKSFLALLYPTFIMKIGGEIQKEN